EDAKHQAQHSDEYHATSTFVTVPSSKKNRGCNKSNVDIAAQSSDLALKVATENDFLYKASRATEQYKKCHAYAALRTKHVGQFPDFTGLGRASHAQQFATEIQHNQCCHNKTDSHGKIEKKIFNSLPTTADQVSQLLSSQP